MCSIYYFCQILAKIAFNRRFCRADRRTDGHDKGGIRFTQLFYYRPRKRKVSLSADNWKVIHWLCTHCAVREWKSYKAVHYDLTLKLWKRHFACLNDIVCGWLIKMWLLINMFYEISARFDPCRQEMLLKYHELYYLLHGAESFLRS